MIVDRTMQGLKKRAELGKYTAAQGLEKVSQAESEALTETCHNLYNTALGMNAAERRECLRLLGSRVEIRASGDVRFTGTLPLYHPSDRRALQSSISFTPSGAGSTSMRPRPCARGFWRTASPLRRTIMVPRTSS